MTPSHFLFRNKLYLLKENIWCKSWDKTGKSDYNDHHNVHCTREYPTARFWSYVVVAVYPFFNLQHPLLSPSQLVISELLLILNHHLPFRPLGWRPAKWAKPFPVRSHAATSEPNESRNGVQRIPYETWWTEFGTGECGNSEFDTGEGEGVWGERDIWCKRYMMDRVWYR